MWGERARVDQSHPSPQPSCWRPIMGRRPLSARPHRSTRVRQTPSQPHPPTRHLTTARATSHFITFAFFATLKFHLFQFSILERKALSIPCVGHLGLTGRVVAMRGRRYGHGRVSSGGPPRFAGPDDGFSAAVASDNDNTKR
jgi:hypothetical protein